MSYGYNNNNNKGNSAYNRYPSTQNYYTHQINKHNPQKYNQKSYEEIPCATQEGFPMDLMMDDIPTTSNLINEEYDVDASKVFQYNVGYALAMENAITIYNKAKFIQDASRNPLISPICLQIVRSSNSVGANLAESNNSKTTKMLLQKLYVAYGELNETLSHLEFLYKTNHLTKEEHQEIYNKYIHIIRIIRKSIHTIKAKEEQA